MNPNHSRVTKYVILALIIVCLGGLLLFFLSKNKTSNFTGNLDPQKIRNDIYTPGPTLTEAEKAKIKDDLAKPPNIAPSNDIEDPSGTNGLSEEDKARIRNELK